MEILVKCPRCSGQSTLVIGDDPQLVSCGLCDELLFEYELATNQRCVVYVLSNSELSDLVKVGCTRRTAADRAEELNAQTGVAGEFTVEAYWHVDDPFESEGRIHQLLDEQRLESKEFFRVSVPEVIDIIQSHIGNASAYSRSRRINPYGQLPQSTPPSNPVVDWRLAK